MNSDPKIAEFYSFVQKNADSLSDSLWDTYEEVTDLAEKDRYKDAVAKIRETKDIYRSVGL